MVTMLAKVKELKALVHRYVVFEQRYLPVERIIKYLEDVPLGGCSERALKEKVRNFSELVKQEKVWDERFFPVSEVDALVKDILKEK